MDCAGESCKVWKGVSVVVAGMADRQYGCTCWEQVHVCQRRKAAGRLLPQVCHRDSWQGGLRFQAQRSAQVKCFTCASTSSFTNLSAANVSQLKNDSLKFLALSENCEG
jgi:hypothetical protein